MNEKEASENIEELEKTQSCLDHEGWMKLYKSRGYLEAIKKAKGLEKALQTCQAYRLAMNETGLKNIDKALAKWEKEK